MIKGWAQDAHDAISKARVLLAPLRFGAGLKGKLIDAALLSTPAVTTSIGAEGMYGSATPPALIHDDPTAFANAAIDLYTNHIQWQALSQNAPAIMLQRFDFDHHHNHLHARLDLIHADIEQHRACNFTGLMLRHHSMKSTQFMAQWIEAKNKLGAC